MGERNPEARCLLPPDDGEGKDSKDGRWIGHISRVVGNGRGIFGIESSPKEPLLPRTNELIRER